MIARIWHGKTKKEIGDVYLQFLINRALPDYKEKKGNLGAYIFREDRDDESHFLTVSYWDGYESIKNFAGDDISFAKYYDEDKEFLLEFEKLVRHYEVYS
ncbi:MAG: hypothetical protein ACYC0Q_13160 [Eubacteriales bacterium]